MTALDTSPITYSVNDAAKAIGISRASIYQHIRDGNLAKVKLGHRTLIPADSLRALVLGTAA